MIKNRFTFQSGYSCCVLAIGHNMLRRFLGFIVRALVSLRNHNSYAAISTVNLAIGYLMQTIVSQRDQFLCSQQRVNILGVAL